MLNLSSLSTEGLSIRVMTDFAPSHRDVFKGRAQVTIDTGEAHLRSYPTSAELRALAVELALAADTIEASIAA